MWHRRDAMIRLGQIGGTGLVLPGLLRAESTPRRSPAPTAKSCILIYLWGGPPQQDTFDLKPDAPEEIRGPFRPISTNVAGIQISDQLPRLARHADKFAIIRSLTHDSNNHEPSVYRTLTGRTNNNLVVPRNQRNRQDFPNVQGVVSMYRGGPGMPASVTLPRPIGHDGVTYSGTHAGFLGAGHDPFEFDSARGTSAKPVHRMDLPEGLDQTRLIARRGLLEILEEQDRLLERPSGMDDVRARAFSMLVDPRAKRAFRVDEEPDPVRDRYGRNEWGETMLLARRLVEAGVRLVTMYWMYIAPNGSVVNVWDNHGGTGSLGGIGGYEMLKQPYCLPSLDQGMSALLEDLSDRGLLAETLVASYGEFGRTHRINKTAGRDHWGPCQSVLLAGGGIRGGQVHGASDRYAAYPSEDPVSPEELLATIYGALGVSADSILHDALGRPHRLVDAEPIPSLLG